MNESKDGMMCSACGEIINSEEWFFALSFHEEKYFPESNEAEVKEDNTFCFHRKCCPWTLAEREDDSLLGTCSSTKKNGMLKSSLPAIIERVRKDNPYPKDVFIEPTKKECSKMRIALKESGLTPDAFFGSFGRKVWNNCCDQLIKEVE